MLRAASEQLTIFVFDDNKLLSHSICLLLQRLYPDALVLQSDNSNNPEFKSSKVNLILYLLSPPYLEGVRKLMGINNAHRNIPVIVVYGCEDEFIESTLHGADFVKGYVRLLSTVEEFAAEIDSVLNDRLITLRPEQAERKSLAFLLTSRQLETFLLLCQGKTNKEIASLMGVSDNTIRTYVSAILSTLGVRNRTEAANLGKSLFAANKGNNQPETPHATELMDINMQHRNLFSLINQLNTAIDEKSPVRMVARLLHSLIQNAKFHFMVEEQLMRQCRYPEKEAHRQEHATLLRGMRSIKKQLQTDDDTETLTMIGQSMVGHTENADDRLENFILATNK